MRAWRCANVLVRSAAAWILGSLVFAAAAVNAQDRPWRSVVVSAEDSRRIAVFDENHVALSTDDGMSWRVVYSNVSPPFAISAVAILPRDVILVAERGLALACISYIGTTAADQNNNAAQRGAVQDQQCFDDGNVIGEIMSQRSSVAFGIRGQVYLSRDRGQTFVRVSIPSRLQDSNVDFYLDDAETLHVTEIDVV